MGELLAGLYQLAVAAGWRWDGARWAREVSGGRLDAGDPGGAVLGGNPGAGPGGGDGDRHD